MPFSHTLVPSIDRLYNFTTKFTPKMWGCVRGVRGQLAAVSSKVVLSNRLGYDHANTMGKKQESKGRP